MPKNFASKVIEFNKNLKAPEKLPENFRVLNPFQENEETMEVMEKFYKKYYADKQKRKFLIGINPGRHGAGVTGVPFTDTKRLDQVCGIPMRNSYTHEVSSVFVYDMIEAYGGPQKFFSDIYINSPFPLAIVQDGKNNKEVNANYYDDKELFESVKDYMIEKLEQQIEFGLDTSEVYILGKKNAQFIKKLNDEKNLFEKLVVLDHPRYIQQYKSKEKENYIADYLQKLSKDGL